MFFTDRSKAVLILWIIFAIFCVLSFIPVCSLWHCGHLLGKGLLLGPLVSDVLLGFCNCPMWGPESGVVVFGIDS